MCKVTVLFYNLRACSVVNVFSGIVATQLRRGGKLRVHLEAMIFGMLCAKRYEDRLKLL